MKKIVLILLVALLMAGCSQKEPVSLVEETLNSTPVATSTPAPTNTPVPMPRRLTTEDIINIAQASERLTYENVKYDVDILDISQHGRGIFVYIKYDDIVRSEEEPFADVKWVYHLLHLIHTTSPGSNVEVVFIFERSLTGYVDDQLVEIEHGLFRFASVTFPGANIEYCFADSVDPCAFLSIVESTFSFYQEDTYPVLIDYESVEKLWRLVGFDYQAQSELLTVNE